MVKKLLFTKEDIEKSGFIYEPDVLKCKPYKCGLTYNTFTVNDGVVINYPPIYEDTQSLGFSITKEEFLNSAVLWSPYTHVNSIYVNLPEAKDVVLEGMPKHFHGHPKVMICGHTRKEQHG